MQTIRRKSVSWALCILLVLGVFLSACFLVREVRHTCTGPSCSVCLSMRQAAQRLRAGSGVPGTSAAAAVSCFVALCAAGSTLCVLPGATLVTRKVRLDD